MHGCWIGKNIGGTLGDAYEGTHDILDIKGFSTAKGEAAPNDEKYFTDGVHPNDKGFEYYGQNSTKELTRIIKSF